jgi:type I restriction enzyme S subunit
VAKRAAVSAEPVERQWGLPDDWRWERLGDVADINPKTDISSLPSDQKLVFLPMAAVAEESGVVSALATRRAADVAKGFTRFRSGDVLFAKITPCMENGKVAVVPDLPGDVGAGSTEFHVVRCTELDARFLFHFLVQRAFRQEARRNMSGSAGQLRVPTEYLRLHPVPVPPYDVQQRIVARIDGLFAEIDEGERALAGARDGLETHRKSLLKAAVTGELTADWRRANPPTETGHDFLGRIRAARRIKRNEPIEPLSSDLPRLPKDWTWVMLGDVFDVFVGATPPRGDTAAWGGSVPWVSSGEVAFCRIRETRESIAPNAVAADRIHPPGTVLLGMIGEGRTRGQAAILDVAAAHNQNCASIRVSETPIPPEYVFEYLVERYQETRREGAGGNQPALNKARVRAMPMPLPPLVEMNEIVRRLSAARLRQDDVADLVAEAEINSRDLRQSILAAAFRGELAA